MSMNIHLKAWLPTEIVGKSGKKIMTEISHNFNCVQTTTLETDMIIKSSDIYQEYKEYILDRFKNITEEKFIYENDYDYLSENEPIDIILESVGELHIKELDEFLEEYKDWNIEWFSM